MKNEFFERLEKLKRGMEVADRICGYDTSVCYIIINRHIGDSTRAFKVLKSIRVYYGLGSNRFHFSDSTVHKAVFKKKKLIQKIVVVTTKSISGVAKLYSDYYDEMIILNKSDLDALELYAFSGCAIHENIFFDENPRQMISRHWNNDEGSWTRTLMFGITDLMWELCLPSNLPKGQMKISNTSVKECGEVIEHFNIDIAKTVIICPIAKNSSMLAPNIWESFADLLIAKGYRIFTNAFGEEKTINGTERIEVDIDVIVCLANMGVRIIGVQCGLMDIIVKILPEHVTVINVIKTDKDKQYAKSRGAINEVNHINNVTYLRIEHFEEDYVLKLLMDNFH